MEIIMVCFGKKLMSYLSTEEFAAKQAELDTKSIYFYVTLEPWVESPVDEAFETAPKE